MSHLTRRTGRDARVLFQSLATTDGKRDWSSFDATIAAARARNVHVVVTLADQWGACDLGDIKDAPWYTDGYRTETPEGLPATYREWVSEIVTRYRDDPAIFRGNSSMNPKSRM